MDDLSDGVDPSGLASVMVSRCSCPDLDVDRVPAMSASDFFVTN